LALFVAVALLSGMVASRALASTTPERRRLRDLAVPASGVTSGDTSLLTSSEPKGLGILAKALPSSPKEMGRLRRQMIAAGRYDIGSAVYYSLAKLVTPVLLVAIVFLALGVRQGWILMILAGVIGYLLPDLVLARMRGAHAKAIQNGLPDVLDLLIVCIEAGSSLDQSIVKASDELGITHPALAHELKLITTEIRAGKPRLEAFRNFAARTRVDDVRALVTMLTQTDRFGTSVAQALRIHADTSRTKRRQRAEERAAKVGVKLVFPLVLCVFPAVYVVCIGSAVVAIYRALLQ
jgi:tight adherence protein C